MMPALYEPTLEIRIKLPISVIVALRRVSRTRGQLVNEYVRRAVLWQIALDDVGKLPAETEESEPESA